jgi:hypothetical protein
MRLMPHQTTRIAARGSDGKALKVRVRNEDVALLQRVAVGGCLSYVVSEFTVLVSSANPRMRLEMNLFESCVLRIPTGRMDVCCENRRSTPRWVDVILCVAAMRMLPGKGSSLAHRAIATLRLM